MVDEKAPDSGEPSELRELLAQLELNPTHVLNSDMRNSKYKWDSKFAQQTAALRTLNNDLSKVKRQMPADPKPDLVKIEQKLEKVRRDSTGTGISVEKINREIVSINKSLAILKHENMAAKNMLKNNINSTAAGLESIIEKRRRSDVAKSGNIVFHSDYQAIAISLADWPDYVDIPISLRYERTSRLSFTAADTDIITSAAHGLTDWDKIVDAITDDTLPAGLAGSTVYYVIYIDSDTFKLTTDKPGTASPTPVDITDSGTGNHKLVAVTDALTHTWYQDDAANFTIADTVVDLDITYDSFDPSSGDVVWLSANVESTLPPRFVDGVCVFRINLPAGTYLATETITLTAKKTNAPLLSNVADLPCVITVTA
jgi:hypothetical protein